MRSEPVVLVHGWGGSFATTWQATGVGGPPAGRRALGHRGRPPRPRHRPQAARSRAYADLTARIVEALPADGPVDADRLLAGRHHAARAGHRVPERFGRLVVGGVGAQPLRRRRRERAPGIVDAVDGRRRTDDNVGRTVLPVRQPAGQRPAGPRRGPAAAGPPRPHAPSGWPPSPARSWCASATSDFAGPADPLAEKPARRPAGRAQGHRPLRHAGVVRFIDAALEFLEAVPA